MADWPLLVEAQRLAAAGKDTATSAGTLPATAGSTHTKTGWTELIASTPHDAAGLLVEVGHLTAAGAALVDLGIGPAASEQVLIPNMQLASGQSGTASQSPFYPIPVPAGSRLAVRWQGGATSVRPKMSCQLLSQGFKGVASYGRVSAYGVDLANSRGTTLDGGGTAHTKTGWVELVAACDALDWAVLWLSHGTASLTANVTDLVDIGVGAAASEVVVVPNIAVAPAVQGRVTSPQAISFPLHVRAGERIAARMQSSSIVAGDRALHAILHGVS